MAEQRKYWLKISDEFLDLPEIEWITSKKDGSKYLHIYLKLCAKSSKNNGLLITKVNQTIIPFDSDYIYRLMHGLYSESVILAAIACLMEVGLIYNCTENNCLAIANIEQFIISESSSAERMRRLRERRASQCDKEVTQSDVTMLEQNVTSLSHEFQEKESNQRKRIKENKINLKINYLKENSGECDADVTDSVAFVFPSQKGDVDIYQSYVDEMQKTFPAIDVPGEIRKAKNWCFANPKNTKTNVSRFLYNWFTKAQDKAPRVGNTQTARVYKNPDSNRYHDVGEEVDL